MGSQNDPKQGQVLARIDVIGFQFQHAKKIPRGRIGQSQSKVQHTGEKSQARIVGRQFLGNPHFAKRQRRLIKSSQDKCMVKPGRDIACVPANRPLQIPSCLTAIPHLQRHRTEVGVGLGSKPGIKCCFLEHPLRRYVVSRA